MRSPKSSPSHQPGGVMIDEDDKGRRRRRHLRTLFDSVADLYDRSRRGYPAEIVDLMVATAGLGAGSAILEVGCGTGQLTSQLARRGFVVTAIDIGPSMVAVARHRVGGSAGNVGFEVVSFEDLAVADAAFDLVVSATAFHWVDPDVRFAKSARLLRPGGWLALLSTGERYDDPFGTALVETWAARSDDSGGWVRQRKLSDTGIVTGTGLFDEPVEATHSERMFLPTEVVIGVENTRATSLSWSEADRRAFTDELRQHLRDQPGVHLTQETSLTMAALAQPG